MNTRYFIDQEVDNMKAIFRRLEPKTLESLQYFSKYNNLQTGCTMVINNKRNNPICIFQNFQNLSPFRMKLLIRLADKIPYQIHINKLNEDIMRIGWKIE
ncbi:hypothetical protein RT99_05995 [Flavobacterium sp. MEB061]|uniref:hypothetical protein n=1 Tax=Flavobacterium sp. MEB061 TaxID=1587524 RepID=UPI0005AD18F3|nr:hypothetical protein [Flavobacterium sp. MEB061]KIQ22655.1 hypothetical protein RT99_05995 [Flavobacterium sp. MEB061]